MLLDLRERGQQRLAGDPRLLLDVAELAAALALHALRELADIDHQLIDQRRLQRQVLQHRLDRGAVLRDPLGVVGPRGLAAPLVGQRRLQALDLPLQAPDAGERGQARADLARGGLAAFRQQDHVVQRNLVVAHAVHQREQLRGRVRDAPERAAQGDLADLDALADRDLLLRLEQGDLADLLQVEAHRILGRRGRGSQGGLGERGRLVQLDRRVYHPVELVVDRRRHRLPGDLGLSTASLRLGGAHFRLAGLDGLHGVAISKGHHGPSYYSDASRRMRPRRLGLGAAGNCYRRRRVGFSLRLRPQWFR